jgi:AsmA protein
MRRQAAQQSRTLAMPFAAKNLRVVMYIFATLTLLSAIALTALYCFAQANIKPLAQRFLEDLAAQSGFVCTVGEVDIVPLPVPHLVVKDLTVEGRGLYFSAEAIIVRHDFSALLRGIVVPRSISGTVRALPWLEQLVFTAGLSESDGEWAIAADMRGHFRKDEVLLPFSLSGSMVTQNQRARVNMENIVLQFGDDSGQLDAVLTLPEHSPDLPKLQGRLQLRRLSLTRWFGFARNLTPGLQVTLDNVTDGVLDFTLDKQGLTVPSIVAHAANARFTGSGGVESWAKPTVVLDLTAERLRLETGIPEAAGTLPAAPQFMHETLTPMPGEPRKPAKPDTPDEIDIGYDIRLGAQALDYGPLLLNDALVVIRQGKTDKNGYEDTLLIADAQLYNGTVHGETTLGGGRDLTCAINLRLRNIEGAPLVKALPVIPVNSARFQADCNITSQGRKLAAFLANLKGTVAVKAAAGDVHPPTRQEGKDNGKSMNFSNLEATLTLRSAVWKDERLGLNGQWQATLNSEGMNIQTELRGTLHFGGNGADSDSSAVDFQDCPGLLTLLVQPERGFLQKTLQAKLSGDFSRRSADRQLSIANARLDVPGIDAQGNVQISEGKSGFVWTGNIIAKIQDANAAMRLAYTAPAQIPPPLRAVTLEAAFRGTADELALSSIRARFDQMTLAGAILLSWQQQLRLDFDLEVDHLNLDRFRDSKSHDSTGKKTKTEKKSPPWDLRFMRAVNARGELRAARLTVWKLQLQSVKLPVSLANGRLTCAPATASFYGTPLKANSSIEFTEGLSFECSLAAENFALSAVSADRGGNAALSGRGSLTASVRGALTGSGQMPSAVNGNIRFNVKDASYQKREDSGELKGKVTSFHTCTGTGVITGGVLRGNDFRLQGDGLEIKGGGWIDLNNDTLDCRYIASMKNLPDVPVHIYGTLDDTKISVNAGKVLLNTLGDITQGVAGILGGIIRGAWHIFR